MTSPRRLFPLVAVSFVSFTACGRRPVPNVEAPITTDGASHDGMRELSFARAETDAVIPIETGDAVRGSRFAPVTVVVFADLECRFSAQLSKTLERLEVNYGREQLRVVFKNLPQPFHQHARFAAEVGAGVLDVAGQGAFWRFQKIASENRERMSPESIREWATRAGVSPTRLELGLKTEEWTSKIDRDEELAHRLGLEKTPTSFINGIQIEGAEPFETFKQRIDAELSAAKALVDQGTPRSEVYAARARANYRAPTADVEEEPAEQTVYKIPVDGAPTLGPATALVTIVEFCDFQSAACKSMEPTLSQVRGRYPSQVRFVWRDVPSSDPLSPRASALARAARAQQADAGFWTMHDLLFQAQPLLDESELRDLARDAHLDVPRAMSASKSKAVQKELDIDMRLARDLDAAETPQFFINGRRLSTSGRIDLSGGIRLFGSNRFEQFTKVIDAEIAKAEKLVAAGTARAVTYEKLIEHGVPPVAPKTPPKPSTE